MIWSGVFGSIIIGAIVKLIYLRKDYKEELIQISAKEYKLKEFLPIGMFLNDTKIGRRFLKGTNLNIMQLYGKQEYTTRLRLYEAERTTAIALMILGCILLVFILSLKNIGINNVTQINKPEFGEGEKSYRYYYNLENEDNDLEGITILVPEKKPNEEEIEKELKSLLINLPNIILSENESFSYVDKPLNLPKKIKDGIEILWKSENEKVLLNSGEIRYNNLAKKGEEVILIAYINCYGKKVEEKYKLNIYNKKLNKYEEKLQIKEDIKKLLSKEETSNNEEEIVILPKKIKGYDTKIYWYNGEKEINYFIYLIYGCSVGVLVYISMELELKRKVKERQEEILKALPGFINKFVLLMNGGMSFSRAWEKITHDYCKNIDRGSKKNILYEEMIITLEDIQKGISEIKAYEAFGHRCKIPEVLRFTAIIIQNIKKGSYLLMNAMEQQSKEALIMREDIAKKKGEKASTKLVIPMSIMFLSILIIVIAPALISLKLG